MIATRGAMLALGVTATLFAPLGGVGQEPRGREAIEALDFPDLEFEPPALQRLEIDGVEVLYIPNGTFPLVTVHAYFRGGYGLFGRERYAAAMGLPTLLRYGGTERLSPSAVDETLERLAIQSSFGSAGGSVTSSVNTLTEHLPEALDLWTSMLTEPAFESDEIEVWRGRQQESVLRLRDDPGRLAFSEFNTLLFGDHPIGWEMSASDLVPERLTAARFREVHERVLCRENLILGVTGDLDRGAIDEHLGRLVQRVAPCPDELPEPPDPEIRRGGGVYVIDRDLEQAVIVMAHATDVHLGDTPEYFSAMIGNSILGAGGFSSRVMRRVRTEEGFSYGATSLWTTPRENEGILGAVTRTRPEVAVAAIEVILDAMSDLRDEPPTSDEVATAVDQVANGFVFNFATADQIVSRAISYIAMELPEDWLERYLAGVRSVSPESVRNVFAEQLRPEEMIILVVGDADRMGREALERLGPVTLLESR